MKIAPLMQRPDITNRVHEKTERDEFSQNLAQQQKHDEKDESQERKEPTGEELEEALNDFTADESAKGSGLKAQLVSQGPGLKVVLEDARGNLIRQLSGEEFLRLREAVTKTGRNNGKILDKKL